MGLKTNKNEIYRRVYAGKKRLRWHRHIYAFFGLKTVSNPKSVNLGMISARHTTNRQSSKKVTCPFNPFSVFLSICVFTCDSHTLKILNTLLKLFSMVAHRHVIRTCLSFLFEARFQFSFCSRSYPSTDTWRLECARHAGAKWECCCFDQISGPALS